MKEKSIEGKISIPMKGKYGNGVTDIDGNTYKTTIIGTQEWMAENLKVSKYSDGTDIPNITDKKQWQNDTTGAWCYYDNDKKNNTDYGKLYNWHTINLTTNGNKNVCPNGFHIPSKNEWQLLINYLKQDSLLAGGQMKEVGSTHWNKYTYYNTENTNTSLFTALPGGYRYSDSYYGDNYYSQGSSGIWWSLTESADSKNALIMSIEASEKGCFLEYEIWDKNNYGHSIRCLKD
jgi:uncharacterized protein (TIGR02145 family)